MTKKELLQRFVRDLPFKEHPYSKRNWGHPLHSLCSFSGKLKPALAHHLIDQFTSESDVVFDCFSGSGTVPFEAGLMGRRSMGLDYNPVAVTISKGKTGTPCQNRVSAIIDELDHHLIDKELQGGELQKASSFGFNKTLDKYYHSETLKEILLARQFFRDFPEKDDSFYLVAGSLLHILHGNRPYALSRRSHPITPYAPQGDYEYKSLLEKLRQKVDRGIDSPKGQDFVRAEIFAGDILQTWHESIQNLDAIITSPPFFDSTKFYLTNWIRNWFMGWEVADFENEKNHFIETKQKTSMAVYGGIFDSCRERLNKNGIVLMHLGKSKKKDMGAEIGRIAKNYFSKVELVTEDVSTVEHHGIRDKGSVNEHQYLLLSN